MPATTDRGDVLHLAGFHRLSPALRDGAPALVAGADPQAARCGWEAFFDALERTGRAVAWTPGDPTSVRLVPRAEARRDPPHRPSLARAAASARKFLDAWRGRAV
jgi:hypothetical protein